MTDKALGRPAAKFHLGDQFRVHEAEATAATPRWRVAFAPSAGLRAPGSSVPLLGCPRFRVCLERYAGLPPLH